MVQAEHALVTEGLGVAHLRLVMGTSMGCMHAFMWGERWPDGDGRPHAAGLPAGGQIAGRNRLWRSMIVDVIKNDPAWKGGDYAAEPAQGLRAAADILTIAGSAPHQMQKAMPDRRRPDAYLKTSLARSLAEPRRQRPDLSGGILARLRPLRPSGKITAPVMWINSADDFINPPELGIAGARGPKSAARPLRPAADQRRHPRPRHPHLGGGVEGLSD